MKIFVVSLKDSPRREVMQNQMDALGIDFEFFDAVDGRNGVPKEHEHLVDYKAIRKNIRRDLTSGEIGCALSHKFLYDKIVEDEIEHTVILEDDAIIDEDFKEILEAKALEKDEMGFIFLFTSFICVKQSSSQPFFKNYLSYKSFSYSSGTVAYYVDLEMSSKLQNLTKTIKTFADDWQTIGLNLNNFKILYPRLICHPPVSAEQTTMNKRQNFIKKNRITDIIISLCVKIINHNYYKFLFKRNSHKVGFVQYVWYMFELRDMFALRKNPNIGFFRFCFMEYKRIIKYRKDTRFIFRGMNDDKY